MGLQLGIFGNQAAYRAERGEIKMNYYKFNDEYSPVDGGITYIEVIDDCTYRQITVNGDKYIMSNRRFQGWGFWLAEGEIEYDPADEVKEISKDEFESIWNNHLDFHRSQWDNTKQKYKVGNAITGHIEVFYPQGVIVNLDEESLGVANYDECRATAKWEWMYPGYRVTAIVDRYDEINHWLILKEPRVYGDRIRDYRIQT
jgi:hypothetical protein